jgi:hypothetical protein
LAFDFGPNRAASPLQIRCSRIRRTATTSDRLADHLHVHVHDDDDDHDYDYDHDYEAATTGSDDGERRRGGASR